MELSEGKEKISEIISNLKSELSKLRTGSANPEMLEGIEVEVYESKMPINHLATVSIPDARTIVIQPWDSSNVKAVEKALLSSDLGITPSVDGTVIRLSIPALTQELREDMVREMKEMVEEARVAVRGVRHKMMNALDEALQGGGVSEDDIKRQKDEVEKVISDFMENFDEISDNKEKSLMTI